MINTKKLNQYMKSESNSPEMKGFVQNCVNDILGGNIEHIGDITKVQQYMFLKDLNLLTQEKINS